MSDAARHSETWGQVQQLGVGLGEWVDQVLQGAGFDTPAHRIGLVLKDLLEGALLAGATVQELDTESMTVTAVDGQALADALGRVYGMFEPRVRQTVDGAELVDVTGWPSLEDVEVVRRLGRAVYDLADVLIGTMSPIRASGMHQLRSRLPALMATLAIEEQGRRTEQVLAAAEQAGGVASVSHLAEAFESYANQEGVSATGFRWGAIGVVVAAVVAAAWQASVVRFDGVSEIAKLAWTLPAAGLATYLARESNDHRRAARWARILTVQLRTITAYCESLGDDHETITRLRAEFGARAFLAEAPIVGVKDNTPAPTAEVVGLLQQLLDATRATTPAAAASANTGDKKAS